MMDVVTIALGAVLLLVGLACCFLPLLPGPVVSYAALFTLYLLGRPGCPPLAAMIACGALTAGVMVLDFVMPGAGAKKFHCSKAGVWGSVIGSIVGMFFFPLGLVLGPFLGALMGELIARKGLKSSSVGAFGAFAGFAAGLLVKVLWCLALAGVYAWMAWAN